MKSLYDGWWDDCALWGQLNLQEHEPARIDLDWWTDYWRRTCIDGVTLNAGGIIHYYGTEQAHSWISPWMNEVGDRDIFGEMVEAARRCDLYVLARFTPSRVHEEVARSHPDWLLTDSAGQPVPDPRHDPGASVRMWYTCMNGPWYRDWLPNTMFREVMERYDVDGFFLNAWQPPERTIGQDTGTVTVGPCHCSTCTRRFRDDTSLDVPVEQEWSDPGWRRWTEWHNNRMDELTREYQSAAKSLKEHATVVMNMGGDLERMNDSGHWREQGRALDMVDHDYQSRRGPIWTMGLPGKMLGATMPDTPYYHLFGAYGGLGRISAQPDAELELITAEMMAAGCRLWYHVIGAAGPDRRPFEAIERIFSFYDEHRDVLRGAEPAAEIAVLFSQSGADAYGGVNVARLCGEPLRGMAHALVRDRIAFDLIETGELTREALARFRVAVLPNLAPLSDEQCEVLRRFVADGGGLVATFESSLAMPDGSPRNDFGLSDVFGVSATASRPVGPIPDAHYRIEEREIMGAGLDGADAIATTPEMWHVPVRVANGAVVCATLIPPMPRMPPERSFFGVERTTTALAVANEYGAGRVVYFPCDIDRWCRPDGPNPPNSPDHRRILANAIRWAAIEPFCVEVAGPGLLDVHARRVGSRFVVHLVNAENADNGTPPACGINSLGAQRVSLRLPSLPSRVKLPREGSVTTSGDLARDGDAVVVAVPGIDAHEVVVCEFETPTG